MPESHAPASGPRRAYGDWPTSSSASPAGWPPQRPSSPAQPPNRAAGPYDWQPPSQAFPSYGPAQAPQYGSPQAPQYGSQPTPQYGSQPSPSYRSPQNPAYGSPQAPYGYPQQGSFLAGPHGQPPPAPPPYGPPGGYAPQWYAPQGYAPGATPWASTQQWAPPSGYPPFYQGGVTPGQPYGPYGPETPYPQGPRRRKGQRGRTLLVLLSIAILVGAALPMISTIASSGYANSAYVPPQPDPNPPALPRIANGTSAHDTVTSSALYGQTVPNPTKCTVTTIDLAAASESELQSHMSDVVACLMRVWDVTVTKSGYTMPRPPVVVYSAAMATACGKLATLNAAYCGSDQKIYYATDLPQTIPSQLRSSRFIVEVIVAHEFGHAVQARTGILTAAHGLADSASSQAESHEWSRRTELQADCFAGLFIRSVSKSTGITQQDLDNIASLMIAFGDDSLSKTNGVDGGHGLGTTRKYWMQLGLASTSTSVCDTFTVASDEVR